MALKRLLAFAFIAIFVTACTSPAADIPTAFTAAAPTNTSIPTDTPIPSPTLTPTPKPPSVITPENVGQLTEIKSADINFLEMMFSPDGGFLVGESECCAVNFYDSSSLDLIRTISPDTIIVPEPGSRYRPQGFAISPDGNTLAIGPPPVNSVGLVTLWDVNTGNHIRLSENEGQVMDMFGYQIGAIQEMVFSPNGRFLAVSGLDNVSIWEIDLQNARVTMASVIELHNHGVSGKGITDLDFSPDGKVLAIARHGQVKFRDPQTWKEWTLALDTAADEAMYTYYGIERLAFSYDSKYLATVNSRLIQPEGQTNWVGAHELQLWDMATGALLRTMSLPAKADQGMDTNFFGDLAFSPDNRLIMVVNHMPNVVTFWSVDTGELLHTLQFPEQMLAAAVLSPDGTLLAVSLLDSVKIFGVP